MKSKIKQWNTDRSNRSAWYCINLVVTMTTILLMKKTTKGVALSTQTQLIKHKLPISWKGGLGEQGEWAVTECKWASKFIWGWNQGYKSRVPVPQPASSAPCTHLFAHLLDPCRLARKAGQALGNEIKMITCWILTLLFLFNLSAHNSLPMLLWHLCGIINTHSYSEH